MNKEEISKTLKVLELIRGQLKTARDKCAQLTSLSFKRIGLDEDEVDDFLQLGVKKDILIYQKDAEAFQNIETDEALFIPYGCICAEVDNSGRCKYDYPRNYMDYAFIINRKKFDAYFQKLKKEAGKLKSVPTFKENPPRIVIGDKIIPIENSTNQHYACRVLFSKKIGEIVSWDEIAEEIRGNDEIEQDDWRSVYDTVCALNKKVKEKTGITLFKTSRKSFHRLI